MGTGAQLAVALIGGLFTVTIIAVIVSRQAQTPTVIDSGGNALARVIGAAVSPVTGNAGNTFGSVGQSIQGVTP